MQDIPLGRGALSLEDKYIYFAYLYLQIAPG